MLLIVDCFCFQFENCFTQKPELYKKFWESNGSPEQLLQVRDEKNEASQLNISNHAISDFVFLFFDVGC